MFIIVYIIITAAACGMVYLGYLQGTERFYMTARPLFYTAFIWILKSAERKRRKIRRRNRRKN